MSQTIDNKVVELQFNNQDFEKNVATSISTLDRLKASLNLTGAVKGFDGIQNAASKVNFNVMSTALDTVQAKFSALDTIAFTALQNITNKAIDAGEKLVKSLSIDNISAGWEKYGNKTSSVATLIAQGYDMETVNEQLGRLNWYTDETSYNFTDMVANIAKFTATGRDLEESVTAMEGIANWAALSGQNAQTASRAMYQLSQAMGMGVMRLEDYKSIQNASMDTAEFRQKVLDAAVELGTLEKTGENTYRTLVEGAEEVNEFTKEQFVKELTKGQWFTSDVMMKVFNEYSNAVDKIYEYSEEHGVTASEAIEALGGSVDEFGLKAFLAAQEARTFTDVLDSVKDATGTAWMNVFETIFGGYDESRKLWTGMANELYDTFATPVNSLQELLEGAFGGSGGVIQMSDLVSAGFEEGSTKMEAFQKVLISTAKAHGVDIDGMIKEQGSFAKSLEEGWLTADLFQEALGKIGEIGSGATKEGLKETEESLEEIHRLAKEVIKGGIWGNGQARIDALNAAGYDGEKIQSYVNLLWKLTNHDWSKLNDDIYKQADAMLTDASSIATMSDEQLKAQGYTEEEIKLLKELAAEAEKTGTPLNELIDKATRPTGRELFSETILMSIEKLNGAIGYFKDQIANIFPAVTSEHIYQAIKAVHDFVESLGTTNKTFNELKRGLNTIFSAFGVVVSTFTKSDTNMKNLKDTFGGFASAISIVKDAGLALIKHFSMPFAKFLSGAIGNVLKVTGAIGRFVTSLKNALKESHAYNRVLVPLSIAFSKLGILFNKVGSIVAGVVDKLIGRLGGSLTPVINNLINSLKGSKIFSTLSKWISDAYNSIMKFLDGVDQVAVAGSILQFFSKLKDNVSGFLKAIDDFNPLEKFAHLVNKLAVNIHILYNALRSGNIGSLIKGIFSALHDSIFGATVSADDFGESLEGGLADSLTSNGFPLTGALFKALESLAKNIYTSLIDALNWFGNNRSGIGGAISHFVGSFASLLVEGFAKGFDSLGSIFDIVRDFVNGVGKDAGKEISLPSFQKVMDLISKGLGIGAVITVLKGLNSVFNLVNRASKTAKTIGNVIKSYGKSLNTLSKSYGKKLKSEAMLNNAKSIALVMATLVGSVVLLSQVPEDKLNVGLRAIMVISTIVGALIALCKILTFFGNKDDSPTNPLEVFIKGLTDAFGKFAKTAGIGILIAGIGVGLFALVKLFTELSKYDWDEFGENVGKIVAMLGALGGVIVVIQKISGGVNMGTALSIVAAALAIKLIMGPLKEISDMPLDKIIKGVGSISIILLALGGALALAGKSTATSWVSGKTALNFIGLALALNLLVAPILIFAALPIDKIVQGVGTVTWLLGALAIALRASGSGSTGGDVGKILAMTVAISALTGVAVIFANMNTAKLIKGIGAVSILLLTLSGSLRLAGEGSKGADVGKIIAMIGAIAALTASIMFLAQLDTASMLAASVAISAVMLAMAGALRLAGTEKKAADVAAIGVMAACILAIGHAVEQVGNMKLGKALQGALILGTMMVALAGVALIASKTNWQPLLVMSVLVGTIGIFVYLIAQLPIANALTATLGLSALLLSLSGSMLLIGSLGLPGLLVGALGLIAVITIIVAAVELIGYAAANVKGFKENAMAFADLIGTMVGILIEKIGEAVASILPGLGEGLEKFTSSIAACASVLEGVSGDSFSSLESISNSIVALAGAGLIDAITKLIGGDSASGIEKFTAWVPKLGEALKSYVNSINDVTIDKEKTGEFTKLANDLNALAQVIPRMGGLVQAINGEPGYEDFTGFIENLATALKTYVNVTSKVEIDTVKTSEYNKLANDILAITDLIPKMGGLVGAIEGETGYDQFAKFIPKLAAGLITYVTWTSAIPLEGDVLKNTDNYTKLAKDLAEIAKVVPEVGVLDTLLGESDFGTFTKQIAPFGRALKTYVETINEIDIDESQTNKAKTIADGLIALNSALPEDGIIQRFTGGGLELDTFGANVKKFGEGLRDYYKAIDDSSINLVKIAISNFIADHLLKLAKSLEEVDTGGFFEEGKLSGFGGEIRDFGEGLNDYYVLIENMKPEKLKSISTFIDSFKSLAESATSGSLEGFKTENLSEFLTSIGKVVGEEGLGSFIEKIKTETENVKTAAEGFLKAFTDVFAKPDTKSIKEAAKALLDAFSGEFKNTSSISDVGTSLLNAIADGIKNNTTTVLSAATGIITTITEALSKNYSTFNTAGLMMMLNLQNGIESGTSRSNVQRAATSIAQVARDAIMAYRLSMFSVGTELSSNFGSGVASGTTYAYNAGSSLGDSAVSGASGYDSNMRIIGRNMAYGLAKGLLDELEYVQYAASQLAQAAEEATRAAAQVNSPSKVFMRIGEYLGEGLVLGMNHLQTDVANSAAEMAYSASEGMTTAISKISDTINYGLDTQPVIRPVVDLSEVTAGAHAANSMFGFTPSVGVLTNLNAISASVTRRNQNAVSNADVVDAVNSLKSVLGEGHNVYNINGVSYADTDTDIINAIRTLIQFTTMEGRA